MVDTVALNYLNRLNLMGIVLASKQRKDTASRKKELMSKGIQLIYYSKHSKGTKILVGCHNFPSKLKYWHQQLIILLKAVPSLLQTIAFVQLACKTSINGLILLQVQGRQLLHWERKWCTSPLFYLSRLGKDLVEECTQRTPVSINTSGLLVSWYLSYCSILETDSQKYINYLAFYYTIHSCTTVINPPIIRQLMYMGNF